MVPTRSFWSLTAGWKAPTGRSGRDVDGGEVEKVTWPGTARCGGTRGGTSVGEASRGWEAERMKERIAHSSFHEVSL